MEHVTLSQLLAFFGISGSAAMGASVAVFKLLIEKEAMKATKEKFDETKQNIEGLEEKLEKVKQDYVTCKFCLSQHNSLDKTLSSIDRKLDILIEGK